jgi:Thiol:disulfide interchange protein DsbD, N-terminal
MRKNHPSAIIPDPRPPLLNRGRYCSSVAAVSSLWRIIKPLTLVLFLTTTLPASLRAQSDTMSLPDDSAAPSAADAVQRVPAKNGIDLKAGDVQAAIRIANPAQLRPGGKVDVTVHFAVAPGWHIYGAPLPPGEDITPTSLSFDQAVAAHQSVSMPPPTPMHFDALGETLPVYQGKFAASAQLQLAPGMKSGPQSLPGTLSFQECNNLLCKMPRQVPFSVPISVTE